MKSYNVLFANFIVVVIFLLFSIYVNINLTDDVLSLENKVDSLFRRVSMLELYNTRKQYYPQLKKEPIFYVKVDTISFTSDSYNYTKLKEGK